MICSTEIINFKSIIEINYIFRFHMFSYDFISTCDSVETPKLDDSHWGCQPQSTPTIGACEEPGTFGSHGLTRVVACMACICTCIPCHRRTHFKLQMYIHTYIYIGSRFRSRCVDALTARPKAPVRGRAWIPRIGRRRLIFSTGSHP